MPTSPPSVTDLPAFPAVSNRTTYNADAYAHLTALRVTFGPEMAALGANVYANATETSANAVIALTASNTATAAAAVATAAGNFKGAWPSLTGAATMGWGVSHLGATWLLTVGVADVTTKVPGTAPEWLRIGPPAWLRKTSAYTAASFDRIKASTTGGAWSLTFPAAPLDGDAIEVQDVGGTFATNALTLLANGKKIMGFTTSLVLDAANAHLVFVYDATNGDWRY